MASAGGTAQATPPPPSYDTSTAAHLLKQLLGFFNEGLITKDVWEEKQREILSPLVVGTPVVNTNHTLSKGKRPLAVDEDDGGGLAESSKKKKRSKSAAHVHEEGNADADDDDESSETTRTSLICNTLLNMSSKQLPKKGLLLLASFCTTLADSRPHTGGKFVFSTCVSNCQPGN